MPIDLQNFVITQNADVSATIPSYSMSCTVVDSQTQQVKLNLTAGAKITFPQDVASYTAADKKELLLAIMEKMKEIKIRNALGS